MLPLSEKEKVLDFIRKGEKKSYAEVAEMYGENRSSIREIAEKEREMRLSSPSRLGPRERWPRACEVLR